MTELDPTPRRSPLAQSVTRDGKTVRIVIYENGEGGWLLEVVDDYWNSTVWDDSFASDREAFDEALKTIDEEGIDSLIGPSTEGHGMRALDQSLSVDELNELDDFLANEFIEATSMDVSTLEGFLTAIAIGPNTVMPSDWLPWVWDIKDGEAEAKFESEEQANRIMSQVIRYYNAVVHTFMVDPASFEAVFRFGEQWGAAEWCEGFLLGFQFDEAAWSLLTVEQPAWFTPFLRLGTDEGIDIITSADDAEKWMNKIERSLVKMNAYWIDRRAGRPGGLAGDDFNFGRQQIFGRVIGGGLKIGRNDPCPCGSGKKFKKCCGANEGSATLH